MSTYWTSAWDLPEDAPHTVELLGDPCIHVVFERGRGLDESRVVGVWTRLWRRTLAGRGRIRAVKLRAGAARAFLSSPAVTYACRIIKLTSALAITAADDARLQRAVLDPDDDAEGFAALERRLVDARRDDASGHSSLAVAIVDRVAADPELTTTERLAEVSGLGARALQRLFREHVGASPKWVIRRLRLQEVAVRLDRGDAVSLADLAAELGYTDQAHLARDFKAATGRPPSQLRSSPRRSATDARAAARDDSRA